MFDDGAMATLRVRTDMTSTVLLPAIRPATWVETVAAELGKAESGADREAIVLYLFDSDYADLGSAGPRTDLDDLAREQPSVRSARSTAEDAGIDCRVRGRIVESDDATAIVAAADEHEVDRIYMYGRRRNPTGKAVFGSTLQDVLVSATVPVVVVPYTMG